MERWEKMKKIWLKQQCYKDNGKNKIRKAIVTNDNYFDKKLGWW